MGLLWEVLGFCLGWDGRECPLASGPPPPSPFSKGWLGWGPPPVPFKRRGYVHASLSLSLSPSLSQLQHFPTGLIGVGISLFVLFLFLGELRSPSYSGGALLPQLFLIDLFMVCCGGSYRSPPRLLSGELCSPECPQGHFSGSSAPRLISDLKVI